MEGYREEGLSAPVSGFGVLTVCRVRHITSPLSWRPPGAVVSVNSTLRFEARAQWHYRRMGHYQRLARDLEVTERPTADICQEITHVETELAKDWPGFRDTVVGSTQGRAYGSTKRATQA